MRLAQLIGIRDQNNVPFGEKGITCLPQRRTLKAIQHEAQTLKRLLPCRWTIQRDEMGMYSGKIRLYH